MSDLDNLDRLRDETLRTRFCELLWDACGHDRRRYVGWLETLAESRVPTDAMRTHLQTARKWQLVAADERAESEDQRRARLALERMRVFDETTAS